MPIYHNILDVLAKIPENADKEIIPDNVPIVIPTFNTVSYLKFMIDQLEDRGWTNIIVADNNSTYPPMIEYLNSLADRHNVVLMGDNFGPRIFTENKKICSSMPKYFIVTDPDLILNEDMPLTAINKMRRMLDTYNVSKVGLAIDIDSPEERDRFFDARQIDIWERRYWIKKIDIYPEVDDLYAAPIDTTFCLYNRDKFLSEIDQVPGRMTCNTSALRVAGRFTCRHMGWWKDQPLTEEEHEFYKNSHTWSSTENEKKRLGY